MKESESKEQLYICDHVDKCGGKDCLHSKPHIKHDSCKGAYCPDEPYTVKCIPYKEKEEPKTKTKMVGVIWFGEVPVDKCENPVICDEMTGYVYGQVELIDANLVSEGFGGEVGGGSYKTYKVTYPPTPTPEPEPETPEEG